MPQAYTDDVVYNHLLNSGYLNDQGYIKDEEAGRAAYADAQKYGVSADQLDSALGMAKGTAAGWISARGMGALPAAAGTGGTVTGGSSGGSKSDGPENPTAGQPAATGGGTAVTISTAGAPAAAPAAAPVAPPPPPAAPAYQGNASVPDWAKNPSMAPGALAAMAGTARGPATFTVTDNMLASSQLMKLLSADNPYVLRARAKAAEYSNARGLLNSSIGAQAGEAAAIDSALPIAQADAAAYFEAGKGTFEAENTFARDENNFGREGALAALNQGFNLARDDANYRFQSGEAAAGRSFEAGENAADRTFRRDERLGGEAFTASQSALARAADMDIAELQEGGADTRQGRQIASSERMTRAGWANDAAENQKGRDFTASENAAQRTFTTGERVANQAFTANENALTRSQERDLTAQREDRADARSENQINAGLFEMYTNSLVRLQTDPNMSPEQRREAIANLGDFFFNQALPAWQAGFTDPASWPEMDAWGTSANTTTVAANDAAVSGSGGYVYDQASPGGGSGE